MTKRAVFVACALIACVNSGRTARGVIVNGDFSTGDLTGWQTAAADDEDQAVAAPIGVQIQAQGNYAAIATVPYSGSGTFLPLTQLSQTFAITSQPLVFDLGFNTTVDANEVDDHLFRDALAVLLSDGMSTYTLAAADTFGLVLDPFNDAPGTLTRTGSAIPSLSDHIQFEADVASLASSQVTLTFYLLNETDGHASEARVGGVAIVPEPASGILVLAAVGLWKHRRRQDG